MLNSASIRNVKFIKMRKLTMFINAVCVLFLIKLRWGRGWKVSMRHLSSFFFFYLIKVDPLILFRSLASISIILITRFARKLPGCVHQFCFPRGVRAMPRRLQQRKDDPGGHNCNVTANRCPGARFSKIPVIFRARNQIVNSTHKNKGADPGYQTAPFCFISW